MNEKGKGMRILQINAYYGYGSTGSIVKNIEKRGQEEGMEMYSVYWLNRDTALENRNVYLILILEVLKHLLSYVWTFVC